MRYLICLILTIYTGISGVLATPAPVLLPKPQECAYTAERFPVSESSVAIDSPSDHLRDDLLRIPTDTNDQAYKAFVDFERRMAREPWTG